MLSFTSLNFCVVAATQAIDVKMRDTFLYEHQSIEESLRRRRNRLKILKRLPLLTIFYEGFDATYNDFPILTPEDNEFKLYREESLLIERT